MRTMKKFLESSLGKFLKFIDGKRYFSFLIFLLTIDFIFILIYPFHQRQIIFVDPGFDISLDGSYSECFQYFKFGLIVVLMGLLALKNRSVIYLCWAVMFAIIGLDDGLSVHENVGLELSHIFRFKPFFGLRPDDFGEMLVYAFYGLLIVVLATVSYRHDHNRTARAASVRIMILMALLALASGGMDILHIITLKQFGVSEYSRLGMLIEISEDGGELIVGSLITWLTYVVWKQRSPVLTADPARDMHPPLPH